MSVSDIKTGFSYKKLIVPAVLGLILVLLATLPVYTPSYTVVLMITILMYIILTVSWALFSGPTGYVSLAPSAFFGVGMYTAAILGKELHLAGMVIAGGLFSFVLALIIGAITLRLRGIYFAMFTFGLVVLIQQILLWWEITFTHTRGRFVIPVDNTTIYYIMLAIFVTLTLTVIFIRRSKYGLALQSIGQDEEAAAHSGVNVTLVKVFTFAISALFMGAVGAIVATRWTYIDPYIAFNPTFSFFPVLMSIFGGMGQLYGPYLGAAIFAYLEELLITNFEYYYMLIFGIIMVITIVFLPSGIVGLIQRWRMMKWWKGGLAKDDANT